MPNQNSVDINDSNFTTYFKDVRKNKVEPGEVLACWRASADFIDGWVKRHVIELLGTNKMGADASIKIMRNILCCLHRDAIRVCKEMAEDMNNMSMEEVLEKPYRFVIEQFYWAKPEHIPNNPHWTTVGIHDMTKTKTFAEVDAAVKAHLATTVQN